MTAIFSQRHTTGYRPASRPSSLWPMASRLLARYACSLGRASSLKASAAATVAAARLPPPLFGPAEGHRGHGWPWSTERLLCEGSAVEKEDVFRTRPVRTRLDVLVDKAAVPDDILLAWAEHRGSGNQAAHTLVKWTQLMLKTHGPFKGQQSKLVTDSTLLDIMDTVSREVRPKIRRLNGQSPSELRNISPSINFFFRPLGVVGVERQPAVFLAISLDLGSVCQ